MDLPILKCRVHTEKRWPFSESGVSGEREEANMASTLGFHPIAFEGRVMSKAFHPAEPQLSHPEKGSPCFLWSVSVQIKSAMTLPALMMCTRNTPSSWNVVNSLGRNKMHKTFALPLAAGRGYSALEAR